MSVTIHRGDCLDIMRTMPSDSLDVCITDPPYNLGVDYGGHDDAMPWPQYADWLGERLGEAWRVVRLGLVYFPSISNLLRQHEVLARAAIPVEETRTLGWHKREFAGDKFHGGPAMCWEPVLWTPKGKPTVNPVYGLHGRNFLVIDSHRRETTPLHALHPCPKPTEVMAWLVRLFCPEGGSVLDPFAGLATTCLVAQRLGRSAVLIELNADYAAAAERRIRGDAPLFADVKAPR